MPRFSVKHLLIIMTAVAICGGMAWMRTDGEPSLHDFARMGFFMIGGGLAGAQGSHALKRGLVPFILLILGISIAMAVVERILFHH